MGKLLRFDRAKYITIICPFCKSKQRMRQDADDKEIWYQVRPYCCDVMETADGPEWNQLIDRALQLALSTERTVDLVFDSAIEG